MGNKNIKYDLIITIVNKGYALDVINASKNAGAEGGTIINGRGSGIHETAKIFGIPIEPEKEIILILLDKNITNKVLESITKEAKLDTPGKGIAFVIDVEQVVGIH